MLEVAVIGTGFIGSVHARNIARHPDAELVAVSDANIEFAKQIAATTGAEAVTDIAEIFNNKDIHAVLIATPTDTHVNYLKRAADAGKAIYCEKPIGLDYQEAEKAVRAVRAAGVPVMLGFNRRFDASHAAVKEAVDRGEVGKVEIVQLTSRGPKPPPISYVKVSGGQLRDQTIHFFDLLRWLTNDEPVEIYAIGAALVDPAIGEAGDVDTSIVSIRMASGRFAKSIVRGALPTVMTKELRSSVLKDLWNPHGKTSEECPFTRGVKFSGTDFIRVGSSASNRVTTRRLTHSSSRWKRGRRRVLRSKMV